MWRFRFISMVSRGSKQRHHLQHGLKYTSIRCPSGLNNQESMVSLANDRLVSGNLAKAGLVLFAAGGFTPWQTERAQFIVPLRQKRQRDRGSRSRYRSCSSVTMKTLQEHSRHFGLNKPKNVLNYKGRVIDPAVKSRRHCRLKGTPDSLRPYKKLN